MSNQYILDGYNVIHSDPTLSEGLDQHFEETRNQFIKIVSESFSGKNIDIKIIFDGQDDTYGNNKFINNLRVYYTHTHQTADDWIKEYIQKQKSAKSIKVVTNDKSIRRDCLSFGAKLLHSEEFINLLRPEANLDLPDSKDLLDEAVKSKIKDEFLAFDTPQIDLSALDPKPKSTTLPAQESKVELNDTKPIDTQKNEAKQDKPEFKEFLNFDVEALEKEILEENSPILGRIKKPTIINEEQENEITKDPIHKKKTSTEKTKEHQKIMDDNDFDELMKGY